MALDKQERSSKEMYFAEVIFLKDQGFMHSDLGAFLCYWSRRQQKCLWGGIMSCFLVDLGGLLLPEGGLWKLEWASVWWSPIWFCRGMA